MTIAVRSLSLDAVPAAARCSPQAMPIIPRFRMEFPDLNRRRRVLLRFQTAAVRDVVRHGTAVGAYLDDCLAGVAPWQLPGQFPSADYEGSDDACATACRSRCSTCLPGIAASGAALECAMSAMQVWYLQALGVHPDAQRRGVGTVLLAAGLPMVDADKQICHLNTSDPANLEY